MALGAARASRVLRGDRASETAENPHRPTALVSMRLDVPRRALLTTAVFFNAHSALRPACADLSGGEIDVQAQYASGARANGGRGANALLKKRAESGIERVGGDPMFKPGAILDAVRSADGTIVDISFSYPDKWTVAKGPNLDVRDVATSDSAFLLVAPLPAGKKSVADLKPSFFTTLLFAKDGKYGSYGTVDDFKISGAEVMEFKSPSGATQPYQRLNVRFDALTYNQNTVTRQAKLSATSVGGSVFILVAGCLNSRAKTAGSDRTPSCSVPLPSCMLAPPVPRRTRTRAADHARFPSCVDHWRSGCCTDELPRVPVSKQARRGARGGAGRGARGRARCGGGRHGGLQLARRNGRSHDDGAYRIQAVTSQPRRP